MTIEEIREVLNSTDMPGIVAQNIVDSIVEIRTRAYNEGWDDRDNQARVQTIEVKDGAGVVRKTFEQAEEDDPSDPAFVVGAVHAQLEDLTDRERLIVIGDVLTDIANHGAFRSADTDAVDQLVNFVRTPEWSVSMLEDIAEIVRKARPDIGPEFSEGASRAWTSH